MSYSGIDYPGVETPMAGLKGLRVYIAERESTGSTLTQLAAGASLGPYQIETKLGAGGIGTK